MLRLAALLFAATLVTVPLAGCGSSSDDSTAGDPAAQEPRGPAAHGVPAGAAARNCDAYAEDAEALRATAVPCDRARQVMYR